MKTIFFTLVISLFTSSFALATPKQVILIRHGEKPDSGNTLNAQGYERAQALVDFFLTNPAVTEYGTPVAIYAASPKIDDPSGSIRSIETVTPLAQKLGITIDKDYTKMDIEPLVKDIMANPAYDGKMVLVCWEHKMIPPIAQAFGANMAPSSWDGAVFDRAWVITFSGSQVSSFQDIPQNVLPGDSTH